MTLVHLLLLLLVIWLIFAIAQSIPMPTVRGGPIVWIVVLLLVLLLFGYFGGVRLR